MTLTWRDNFWIAGLSETGTKHSEAGKPCEDSFYSASEGQSFVLVVCDGAGSSTKSAIGSRAVSTAVGELLLRNATAFITGALEGPSVVSVARAAIEDCREAHGGEVHDYACTLVALLVHQGQVLACHIGDGAIFVLESEHPRFLSPPTRKGRGTYFVTTEGVQARMWQRPLEHFMTGFLLVSDGAECLGSPTKGQVATLAGTIVNRLDFGPEEHAVHIMRELCVQEIVPRTSDDITLLAARRAYAAGTYGCIHCHHPSVRKHVSRRMPRFFGRCPSCEKLVFDTTEPDRVRTYELIYEKEMRAHGLIPGQVASESDCRGDSNIDDAPL